MVRARLNDIGWTIAENGALTTQDALLSEQFFPPGTQYDAYIAIRDILAAAKHGVAIVDAYMGATLFATLAAVQPRELTVHLLTLARNLKSDFHLEANKFHQQFSSVQVEVRTTSDFHDRFCQVDDTELYHIGASIKDAGSRAFLISKLQDPPIISAIKQYIEDAWNSAHPVPPVA